MLRIAASIGMLVLPLAAAAAPQGPLGLLEGSSIKEAFGQFQGATSFVTIVGTVIKTFLSLLGIIFIGMILFAGYNWMTAMGEKEKVTKAKDTLISAAIGLVIIIAAYSITVFVLSSLTTIG